MAFDMEFEVPARILVVEDEISVAQGIESELTELGYEVVARAASRLEAVWAAALHKPDLVIIDDLLNKEHDPVKAEERIGNDLDIPVVRFTRRARGLSLQSTDADESRVFPSSFHTGRDLSATIEIALHKHLMEKRLREREELHRAAFSDLSEAVLITAEDGAFTYVSANVLPLLGYSPEEILELGTADALLGDDLFDPETLEKYGKISGVIRKIIDGSGRERTLLVTVRRISVKGGTILYSCRNIADEANEHDPARALRNLSVALAGAGSLTEALAFGLDAALQVSEMDEAAIHLIDDDLRMEAAADRVTNRKKNLSRDGTAHAEESSPADREEAQREDPPPATVIPIRYGGKVVASLQVSSLSRREIPPRVLTSLETIAAQVGSALARTRAERTLKAVETGVLLDAIEEMVLYRDRDGKVLWANRFTGESVGRDPSRVEGRYCHQILRQRDSPCPGCPVDRTFETGNSERSEKSTPDGRVWSVRSYPVIDEAGKVVRAVVICRDITDRKKTEKALEESEHRYHALFEDSPVSLWEEDFTRIKQYLDELKTEGIEDLRDYFEAHPQLVMQAASMVSIRDVNEATLKMYKARSKRQLMDGLDAVLCPEGSDAFLEQLIAIAEGKREFETETMNRTLSGEKRHVFLKWSVAPGFEERYGKVLVSLMDITDRRRAEDRVRSSLAEKEVLLREVHHRVKNNLAVMSSLLNLQARHVREEDRRQMFEDARARIHSMAVAHDLLYRAESLADLDIPEYVTRLANHLVTSKRSLGTPIGLRKDIEPVSFGLDTAIPLGLILTELVTNSIKHAFPPGVKGDILISLRRLDDGEFELSVADTGVGLPAGVDPNNPGSLGLNLVKTLVGQLRGAMEVRTGGSGTDTRVKFSDTSRYEQEETASSPA